jgi:hypothetical protein
MDRTEYRRSRQNNESSDAVVKKQKFKRLAIDLIQQIEGEGMIY